MYINEDLLLIPFLQTLNGTCKATVSHQLVVSQPMFGDNAVPFASITCRLSVVMIRLVPLQVGKSHKGFPCRSFCLRGLNPKAAGGHGSKMTLCVCSIASGLLNIEGMKVLKEVQHHISS